mgnify:CR=1 FL=1
MRGFLTSDSIQEFQTIYYMERKSTETAESIAKELSRRLLVPSCDINSLNADIYHLLRCYLTRKEIHSLLQVNSHVHNVYIRYRYISLSVKYSLLYKTSEQFQQRIASLIMNPRKQLALNLSGCDSLMDVSALGGVHCLDLSRCPGMTDVSSLGGCAFCT